MYMKNTNKINLKLNIKSKCKLNKITLYEEPNIVVLNKLIKSTLLKTSFSCKITKQLYENEKNQLLAYKSLINKDGLVPVKYEKSKGMIHGRVFPLKSLGAVGLRRELRGSLFTHNMVDIDIENCHPELSKQLCDANNIKNKYLTKYVEDRPALLKNVQDTYNVNRDSAKVLFIMLLYFGSFKRWTKEYNIEGETTVFIEKFKKELSKIGDNIILANPELKEAIKNNLIEKNKVIDDFKLKSTTVSYYFQELENQILESIYKYCVEHKYITKLCSLCYDGLMIEKKNYKPELLTELNILIKNNFGFDLKFTEKKMTHLLDILDDNIDINAKEDESLFKPYTPLEKEINIKREDMNNKYMYDINNNNNQFSKEIFNNNRTIIIKSGTGTGKTTAVAAHCIDINKKIISIIPRISLANQHKDTFKKKGIQLLSYLNDNEEKELNVKQDNIVICINSLLKLKSLSMEDINNSIIFIDEVASFIESLTDNDTMNRNLKQINSLLMKLIKNAYKVIVSDAIINDGVFELLKHRTDINKMFIVNDYIKFSNVEAIRIKDEDLFLNMIKEKIIKNEPFLFPCDSCKTITNFYIECLKTSPEEFKNKFMLITADTNVKINDATQELKDKFVFYSPSITYGVDFQTETPQYVFLYIKGESIQPSGFYQQTTRTRNIKKLYYYCFEHNEQLPKYNTLDDVKNKYRDIVNVSNTNLNNICVTMNENDDETINENTFFNLFCYNEYVKDIYQTNKVKHYQELLKMNGFKLLEEGEIKQMTNKKEFDTLREGYYDDLFNEYIETKLEERNLNDIIKFNIINDHLTTFQILGKSNEDLIKIKNCIMNKFYFNEILNYNRLLKTDAYIINKIKQIEKETYKIKCYNTSYHKIKVIFDICKLYNINILDFKCNFDKEIKFTTEFLNYYKIVFNVSKVLQPNNEEQLIKLLVDCYKSLMPSLKIINTSVIKLNNKGQRKRIYNYSLNMDVIKDCNDILNIYGFIKENEINENIINNCNIEFIDIIENTYQTSAIFDDDDDDDDDDDIAKYDI